MKLKVTKEIAGVYNVEGKMDFYTIQKHPMLNAWMIFTAKDLNACKDENNWGDLAMTKREALSWIEHHEWVEHQMSNQL